jgi:hypothetical protein
MAAAPPAARRRVLVYNDATMFNPSREEVRRFFCDAWQKQLSGGVLTPLEAIAVDWIGEHPEYQALLTDTEGALAQDFTPEKGQTNPFLHLAMHLSISEQVSIDQPPGIRQAYETLTQRLDSPHEAQHQVMECLGEMLWQAQRTGLPPDGAHYVDSVRRRASR